MADDERIARKADESIRKFKRAGSALFAVPKSEMTGKPRRTKRSGKKRTN